jgi:hypothetical protein
MKNECWLMSGGKPCNHTLAASRGGGSLPAPRSMGGPAIRICTRVCYDVQETVRGPWVHPRCSFDRVWMNLSGAEQEMHGAEGEHSHDSMP